MVRLLFKVNLQNIKLNQTQHLELNFMKKIGLLEHLSPTRANGLVSMINRMKQDAINFNN